MEYAGIPYLEKQLIIFPEGSLDLDTAILADMEKLFGQRGTIDPQLPTSCKHRLFFSQQGLVRALFHPQERLESPSRVLMINFIPEQEIPLAWFSSFYQEDEKFLPCVPIKEDEILKIMAIFSLNFSLIFELNSRMVESVSFVSNQHVQTCSCWCCNLIRQVVSQKHLLRPRQADTQRK